SFPSRNSAKLGMLRTLYFAASAGARSVSTLSTSAFPARLSAAFATTGAAILQGPHHSAQKSTSTGTVASLVIWSNRLASTSIGALTGPSGFLQVPQRPVWARWRAGTRFFEPQCVQVRIIVDAADR